jgi:hypothetical protein
MDLIDEYEIDTSKKVGVIVKAGGYNSGMTVDLELYAGTLEMEMDDLKGNDTVLGHKVNGDEITGGTLYSYKVGASVKYKAKSVAKSSKTKAPK